MKPDRLRAGSSPPPAPRPGTPSLVLLFALWKTALLLLVLASPGPGYDTSSALLLTPPTPGRQRQAVAASPAAVPLPRLGRLFRWDGIYFVTLARRGYVFEQEWAFGSGFVAAVSALSWAFEKTLALAHLHPAPGPGPGPLDPLRLRMLAALLLANTAHLSSVLLLYRLTQLLFAGRHRDRVAFAAAALHLFSPAGVFLLAPYSESLFSLLTVLGSYLYARSLRSHERDHARARDAWVVVAGLAFGLATMVRSNGVLNGMPFGYDVLVTVREASGARRVAPLTRLAALGLGAALVGLGMLIPQSIAFHHFCRPATPTARPWCAATTPSIYTWVQTEYWNVGFLRYWKISNLPLFLLAAPMLAIMLASAVWAIRRPLAHRPTISLHASHPPARTRARALSTTHHPAPIELAAGPHHDFATRCVRRLAMPQLVVALLALSIYHVQVITRLSSGYMTWSWWLAIMMVGERAPGQRRRRWNAPRATFRWMFIYSVVQAALFAAFLPPA
ncbi:MAG: ER membrane glycoprotein subunit of the GPI transamidase complex-like protein [Phylliscum demangeonii]|nr:MAG: ER membrane glycoprotein subunit of the GPI transamidase complex-like protein [Phylliscum demangeonii]